MRGVGWGEGQAIDHVSCLCTSCLSPASWVAGSVFFITLVLQKLPEKHPLLTHPSSVETLIS